MHIYYIKSHFTNRTADAIRSCSSASQAMLDNQQSHETPTVYCIIVGISERNCFAVALLSAEIERVGSLNGKQQLLQHCQFILVGR